MFRIEVLVSWVLWHDPVSDTQVYRSNIAVDYGVRCRDITGQPISRLMPDPNLFTAYVECDQATLDLIDADPNYQILSSEEIINEPTA